MRGLFLALEGTDGAGKSSQLALLADYYRRSGRKVVALHFPRLQEKPYGEMIAAFLRGEYGSADAVHPRLAALLYALDRMRAAPELKAFIDQGMVVIADRYIFSNIAYQCAKIDDPAERARTAEWIETLEYMHHRIPRPDLTLFLDAPPAFTRRKLEGDRQGPDRDYLRGGRDIHESSNELQEKVRNEFLHLAKTRATEVAAVDCSDPDQGMADKATIHSRVVDALKYHALAK